jgi:hypothetical protein
MRYEVVTVAVRCCSIGSFCFDVRFSETFGDALRGTVIASRIALHAASRFSGFTGARGVTERNRERHRADRAGFSAAARVYTRAAMIVSGLVLGQRFQLFGRFHRVGELVDEDFLLIEQLARER